jgi:hypothetical protein
MNPNKALWEKGDFTLVAQVLKVSSSYSPPPPEGFISPMTWGIEKQRDRAFCSRRGPKRESIFLKGHVYFQLSWLTGRIRCCIQKLLWADYECIRSRGKERSSR